MLYDSNNSKLDLVQLAKKDTNDDNQDDIDITKLPH